MSKQAEPSTSEESKREACGIIMPIASMPGYEAEHWTEVLGLISRAIKLTNRDPVAVWAGGAADIIQERIVRNLYEQPIVVCDVSGLNSNVMLELGMRLAFGKPTIIVTDEILKPPFDINAIEYLSYPRDLHILRAEAFIERLRDRIEQIAGQVRDNSYKPFIKTFGPIEPGTPGTDAIPLEQAVLSQLEQLSASVRRIERLGKSGPASTATVEEISMMSGRGATSYGGLVPVSSTMLVTVPQKNVESAISKLSNLPGVLAVRKSIIQKHGNNQLAVNFDTTNNGRLLDLHAEIADIIDNLQ